MEQKPEKTVGVYEKPAERSPGRLITTLVMAIVIIAAVTAWWLLR